MSKYIKRNSPPLSAQDYPNKIKNGNDGLEYISKSDKNKIFRWYKINSMDKSISAKKYYMQFPKNYLQKKFNKYNSKIIEKKINTIKKILEKKNIYLIKIGWKRIYNFIDNAWEYAENYIKNKYYKKNKKVSRYNILNITNFIFYTEKSLFWSQNTGKLDIQWNLDKNSKKYVFDIFYKKFKKKLIKPKSLSKAIIIKL